MQIAIINCLWIRKMSRDHGTSLLYTFFLFSVLSCEEKGCGERMDLGKRQRRTGTDAQRRWSWIVVMNDDKLSDMISCTVTRAWLLPCCVAMCADTFVFATRCTRCRKSHCNGCTNVAWNLRCTTKLAQRASEYYFALSSTALYFKTCTKYFPVLPCTTEGALSISHYYFALRRLQKDAKNTSQHSVGLLVRHGCCGPHCRATQLRTCCC